MESTVAQKLDAIYTLQLIDSRLDAIVKVRGALPEEVQDLEDEIAGYETRLEKYTREMRTFIRVRVLYMIFDLAIGAKKCV